MSICTCDECVAQREAESGGYDGPAKTSKIDISETERDKERALTSKCIESYEHEWVATGNYSNDGMETEVQCVYCKKTTLV